MAGTEDYRGVTLFVEARGVVLVQGRRKIMRLDGMSSEQARAWIDGWLFGIAQAQGAVSNVYDKLREPQRLDAIWAGQQAGRQTT